MTQVVIVNCSSGYRAGGVFFLSSDTEDRLIDCHIRGCHTMDTWASGGDGGDAGGLDLWTGTLTIVLHCCASLRAGCSCSARGRAWRYSCSARRPCSASGRAFTYSCSASGCAWQYSCKKTAHRARAYFG